MTPSELKAQLRLEAQWQYDMFGGHPIVGDALERIEALEATVGSMDDPSRLSRFEYREGEVRTVTYTNWRSVAEMDARITSKVAEVLDDEDGDTGLLGWGA